MDWLVKGILAIAGAIVADQATKAVTGKHIHEHLFAWWCAVRDKVLAWAHRNKHLGVVSYIGSIDEVLSNGMARLSVKGQTAEGRTYQVTVQEVDPDELLQQFPEFAQHPALDLTGVLTT